MSRIIGIDLGTTNSCVAIVERGVAKVIENAEGLRTTPSVVAYTDEQVLMGEAAKRQSITNPKNTLYGIKRLIGRRHTDSEVQRKKKLAPFSVVAHDNGDAWVEVRDQRVAPPEISARILDKMRQTAEDYLREPVTEAVITVPAYFNDSQRQATKAAGMIAGLEVKRIISEPTAAALAFGLDKDPKDRKIAVYDLGGGTFDISIIEIAHSDGDIHFEVLSTNGDTFLGGEDFDQRIINHLTDEFKKEQKIDIADATTLQRLKDAAERAKKELSTCVQTEINLPYITADAHGPKHMAHKMTVDKVESLVRDLAERTVSPCVTALRDANLGRSDITDVILVGGMTRMPLIQRTVKDIFGIEPRRDVNPDESVAIGAAIQAAMLQRSIDDMILLDVTPLSLGIDRHNRARPKDGVMDKVIPKNTTIPTRAAKNYTTASDNQTSVRCRVFQGEQELVKDNTLLGEFVLTDIPPAPQGEPIIEVVFDIDADGILHVAATDTKTGRANSITVRSRPGLTEGEIQQMKQMVRRDGPKKGRASL